MGLFYVNENFIRDAYFHSVAWCMFDSLVDLFNLSESKLKFIDFQVENMLQSIDFLASYTWIKNEIFEQILSEKHFPDGIVLKSFTLEAALAKGENYGSQMIRVKLLYTINDNDSYCSLIIKTGVLDEKVREMIESNGLFLKEVVIYRHVMPAVCRLLREKKMDTILGPVCFATQIKPSYMVFEDLREKDFKNVNRRKGLDFDHLRLCLNKLAMWHATTAVYGSNSPGPLRTYIKPLCTHETPEFFAFFMKPIRLCAEVSNSWKGFERISQKLYALEHTIIDKIVAMFKPGKFNVITHGDLWANNIMFRHDDAGNPKDVLFVDYSAGFWGSPGIDIAYLLYSSSSEEVFENEWSELTLYYHEQLEKNLHALNYTGYIPSLDDISTEVIENSFYAVAISTFLIGLRFLEDAAEADIQSIIGESDFMKELMVTEKYRQRMEFLLKYYDSKGLLD